MVSAFSRTLTAAAETVRSRPRRVLLAASGAAFVLLWGLPTLVIPLATDQVTFALGARTILDGGQLYRDLWDIKPPLIYLIYAAPFAVAGESVEAVRVLDLLNTALVMGAIYLLARRLLTDRAGIIAAGFYAFAYLAWARFDGLGQVESFMAAPIVLALVLYRPDERSPVALRALAAGALVGIAVTLKLSAAVFVLALPIAELLLRDRGTWSVGTALRRLAVAAIGFAAVQAAFAAYLAAGGVLDDYIDIQRDYTVPYSASRWSPEEMSHVRFIVSVTSDWIRSTAFIVAPALLALFFGLRDTRHTRGVFFLALVALVGAVGIWWQGKMFRYHWLIMFPLLAPLAGYAVDRVLTEFGRRGVNAALAASALMAVAFVVFATEPLLDTYDNYRTLLNVVDGSLTRRDAEARALDLLRVNRNLVDYVEREGGPEDKLYVWGFWPVANFWLDRPLTSRFVVNSGLRADWAPDAWRQELVDDLMADPPRFIAMARNDVQPWLVGTRETSEAHLRDGFPELSQFLQEEYAATQDFGLFLLYERLPQGRRVDNPPVERGPFDRGDEAGEGIDLPAGFSALAVAEGFAQPTSLAIAPDGGVYVSQRAGPVFRLVDADDDGVFEDRVPFTSGISGIHGLTFTAAGDRLYVSNVGRVTVVQDTDGDTVGDTTEDVMSDLPHGRHENNGIAFGPDGKLYVTNGSTCNDCIEEDERSATILQANPNGTERRVYARGLRNSYDLVFDPEGRLWATDNGTDPPCNTIDELNLIVEGGDYGWPYGPECDSLSSPIAPIADLGFNTASTGITYYDGMQFPEGFRGNLFITLWGSLDYAPVPGGRTVVRAIIEDAVQGPSVTIAEFASGFERPIDVIVDDDGTLLVLDFGSGVLYRITHP